MRIVLIVLFTLVSIAVLHTQCGYAQTTAPDTGIVNVKTFGAVPDAVMTINYGAGTQSISGTDSTAAIQAAIDYALQNKKRTVCLPDGKYKVTNTLHLGYGNDFYSIALTACSQGRAGYSTLAGVSIYSTKTDRPVINIQGGRRVLIRGIAFFGLNFVWIYNNRESVYSLSATPSAWLDPAITPTGSNPGGIQRHSPYAAITIDAYKGAQPTDRYPTVTYPAWTGIGATQYNKLETFDVLIEDVTIMGFGAGVVGSPNGTNQGDFIKIRDSYFSDNVYGIAMGNSQSRNVEIRNVNFNASHTQITNITFGDQGGTMGGPIENVAASTSYQVFSLETGYALPLTFKHYYMENCVRIGELYGTSTMTPPLTFENSTFKFDDALHRVLAPGFIYNESNLSIIFRSSRFNTFSRLPNLIYGPGTSNITFDGGIIQTGSFITRAGGSLAYARALNYTAGMLIGAGTPSPQFPYDTPTIHATSSPIRGRWVNTSTFAVSDWPIASDLRFVYGSVRAPLNQFVERFTDQNGVNWQLAIQPQHALILTSPGYAAVAPAFSKDVLTFKYATGFNAIWPAHVGDILYHENSGTLFVITALGTPASGIPITAKQMNNMTINSDGTFNTQMLSDLTLAGNTFLINCSIDLPQKVEFGTFTSGSASVTSVSGGDGNGSDITTYHAVNDNLYGYPWNDTYFNWPVRDGHKIATVTNGSPGSMTLNSNALASGRFPIYPVPIR